MVIRNLPPTTLSIGVYIACKRCSNRDRFNTPRLAHKAGWTKIKPHDWWTVPEDNHIGICPSSTCQNHPEES